MTGLAPPLVQVSHLRKRFAVARRSFLHAVDDVSFAIGRGESMGLVGESGSASPRWCAS
jgi:peptide/nickel transport system ATP-binding protein